MRERIILIWLIITLANMYGLGQVHTMSGYIKDAISSEDLIGATLQIEGLDTGTSTNAYGFYSMSIPSGTHKIIISYIGYETVTLEISLSSEMKRDIILSPKSETLEEVVVSATERDVNVSSTSVGLEQISVATLKKTPVVLGETDILKTITLLPGVSSVSEAATGFNVRGGGADQNLILLDEANIYNASHLLGFFSVFNADAVKGATLYKGGIPSKFGGRLSSVLDVRQKEGSRKDFGGTAGIGLIASRLALEGPIGKKDNAEGKGSWIIAGRRSYADALLRLAGQLSGDILYFYDLNVKTNYTLNDKNRIFLSGYFGRDNLELGNIFGFNWGNRSFTLRWNHLYSDRLFGNLSLTSSRYDYAISSFRPGTEFKWSSDISSVTGRKDFNYFLNNKNSINFGIEGNYSTYSPGEITAIRESFIQPAIYAKQFSLETAVYIGNDYKPTNWLGINYGLRYSRFYRLGNQSITSYLNDAPNIKNEDGTYREGEVTGVQEYTKGQVIKSFGGLEPRISARLKVNSKTSFKLGYHRTFQYLHLISNTTSSSPVDLWMPSGPYKKPQSSDQISFGIFKNSNNNKYEFSLEGYYKNLNNLIDYVDGAQLIFNENIETELLPGKGRAYGLELQIQKKVGRLSGWISYTLARTERKIDGINRGNYYLSNYDKTHDLSITSIYELTKRTTFSTNFVFASGQPVTYPAGRYTYSGLVVSNYDLRNQDRLPSYNRLDLSLTIKNKPGKKRDSRWIFSLYNVYNRKNAASITFRESDTNAAGNTTNTGITEAVRLAYFGLVPGISYETKF